MCVLDWRLIQARIQPRVELSQRGDIKILINNIV